MKRTRRNAHGSGRRWQTNSGRYRIETLSFNHPHRGGTCRAESTSRRKYQCRACIVYTSFNSCLPFFEFRRSGKLVDRRSTTPVLVPGLALVFERRVRHVARSLLNSHRCGPSAPPWAPIYRSPHSLPTSEAFAVQKRRMGLNLVDPPLPALAALPESLLHDRP